MGGLLNPVEPINPLFIEGGAGQGDVVNLLGGIAANGTQTVNGETYNHYVTGSTTVLVFWSS